MICKWDVVIREIKAELDTNICRIVYVEDLAEKYQVSQKKLSVRFRLMFDKPLKEYMHDKRLEAFMEMLKEVGCGEVAFYYASKLGFEDESGLCHLLKRRFGMTFTEFVRWYAAESGEVKLSGEISGGFSGDLS